MPNDIQVQSKSERIILNNGSVVTATIEFDAASFMDEFDSDIIANRYSPVLQRRLGPSYQKNVYISGQFRTNYSMQHTESQGGYSFIQVRKNSIGKASAYAGYGIAWRPTAYNTDIEIAITDAVSSELGEGYYDITKDAGATIPPEATILYLIHTDSNGKKVYIPFEYSSINGNVISGCYIPNAEPQVATDKISIASPNVYIVDNNPIHGDNYSAKYIIDPLTGLSYIQSATRIIEKDKTYYFALVIGEDNSVEFYIDDDPDDLTDASNLVISSGATTTLAEYLNTPNMDSFGISVFDTCGYQWWYDNLLIGKLQKERSVLYVLFDVTEMSEELQIEASGYGEGEDIGMGIDIWRPDDGWVTIAQSPATDLAITETEMFKKSEYEENGYIKAKIYTQYPGNMDTPSILNIDYVKLVRFSPYGCHVGGCVDCYIDDDNAEIISSSNAVAQPLKYVELVGKGNIVKITAGTPEVELVYGVDYVMVVNSTSEMNSKNAKTLIKFRDTLVDLHVNVYYWESEAVQSMQIMFDDARHAPVQSSVLVKHKNIYNVSIYSGGAQDVYDAATDYITGLAYINGEKTISYVDAYKHITALTGKRAFDLTLTIVGYDGNTQVESVLTGPGNTHAITETETYRIMNESV